MEKETSEIIENIIKVYSEYFDQNHIFVEERKCETTNESKKDSIKKVLRKFLVSDICEMISEYPNEVKNTFDEKFLSDLTSSNEIFTNTTKYKNLQKPRDYKSMPSEMITFDGLPWLINSISKDGRINRNSDLILCFYKKDGWYPPKLLSGNTGEDLGIEFFTLKIKGDFGSHFFYFPKIPIPLLLLYRDSFIIGDHGDTWKIPEYLKGQNLFEYTCVTMFIEPGTREKILTREQPYLVSKKVVDGQATSYYLDKGAIQNHSFS